MTGKAKKLLLRYCMFYHKPYKEYAFNFRLLNLKKKREVLKALKESLPTVN